MREGEERGRRGEERRGEERSGVEWSKCLAPIQQFFSHIMAKTSYFQ